MGKFLANSRWIWPGQQRYRIGNSDSFMIAWRGGSMLYVDYAGRPDSKEYARLTFNLG